jgi:hypothetical protein
MRVYGDRVSQEPDGLFIWSLCGFLESGFNVHDQRLRKTFNLFASFIEEIYPRSLFLIQLHVRGFSSQRIH